MADGPGMLASREERLRGRRVILLIAAVALMSIADLALTLTYVTSAGMAERNPIARAVMNSNQPGLLIAWKLGTVLLACVILFVVRRKRSGELGAWVCAAILAWLSLHWVRYNAHVERLSPLELATLEQMSEHWVAMGE